MNAIREILAVVGARWRRVLGVFLALLIGQMLAHGCAREYELDMYTGQRRQTCWLGVLPIRGTSMPEHAAWASEVSWPGRKAPRWTRVAMHDSRAFWCAMPNDVVAYIYRSSLTDVEKLAVLRLYHRRVDALPADAALEEKHDMWQSFCREHIPEFDG